MDFDEYQKKLKLGWDITTVNRKVRELLNEKWANQQIEMTDAKDFVLPRLKNWLQTNNWGQFSDLKLAENIHKEEISDEVKNLIHDLLKFTGVK